MGKQYEMAFQIGAKVQGSFGSAFRSAASSVQSLQSTIDQLNRKQGDISAYQRTQEALEKTRAKIALYQSQLANMKSAIEGNENATYQERNALLAKEKALDDLKAKQEQLEGKLQSTGAALQQEGVDLNNLGQASTQAKQEVEALKQKQEELAGSSDQAGESVSGMAESLKEVAAAVGAAKVVKEIGEAMKECAQAAITFENDMAGVKRTVGGSDEFISGLGEDFKELSTQIPITASELAQIATTAGQLGIAQDKVEQFTTVMAKLATTTDLTADEAATMLAQFANITGLTDYERMGAVVAQLGDSTATTASKVVQMSQGMAAAANIAGMSATDIMAISAAVGSLGIEAQAGSTSMSQLITTLYKATETGENLAEFAAVANMTADQFKQAWATDAVGAMNAFITGLNDVERNGRSAIVILDELGINNVRQQKAILGLASAGDLLTKTITQANSAWQENIALDEKASIMYETTQSKLTMLGNAFQNLKIAIGDAFTPVIAAIADALNTVIEPIAQWLQMHPQLVQGLGAAIAVLGGTVAALAAYTLACKIATAASAALIAAVPGLKLIMAISAGVALITGAIVALTGAAEDAVKPLDEFDAEFDTLNESMQHEQHIYDLAQDYKRLSNEVDNAVKVTKDQDFSDIDISIGATADPTINPDDFLIDDNHDVDINGDANGTVDAADLVTGVGEDGAYPVPINPEAGTPVDADALVNNHGIMLHGTPDSNLILDANVLVNNETPVQIHAEWANFDDMKNDVAALKKDAESAKADLIEAKNQMADMEERRAQLQSRLEHAETDTAKTSLASQLQELNAAIEEQAGVVAECEEAYQQTAGQYVVTKNAAESLQGRLEELKAIEDALAGSAADDAEKHEETAEAYNNEAEAAAAAAAAKKKSLITSGAKTYTEAVNRQAEAESLRAKAIQDAAEAQEAYDNYQSSSAGKVRQWYNEIKTWQAEGWDGSVDNTDKILGNLEKINNLVYGNSEFGEYDDYWFNHVLGLEGVIDQLAPSMDSYNEAIITANDTITQQDAAIETLTQDQQNYIDNIADAMASGMIDEAEARALVMEGLAGQANAEEKCNAIMQRVSDTLDERTIAAQEAAAAGQEMAESTRQVISTGEEFTAATQPIIDQMTALAEAYNTAYTAAYNSMNGQFELFEAAPEVVTASTEDMIANMQSQIDYINKYTENLKFLQEAGLDTDILASLSDGSAESAGYIQALVDDVAKNGGAAIDEINDKFSEVSKAKEGFADTVAEMQTDFSDKMAALEEQLNTTVQNMDMSTEAAASAAATMDAFAASAEGKVDKVRQAFAKAAAAAKAALTVDVDGDGYATGTQNAEPGFHVVGEKGPEIVYLNGGEKILNAQDTQRAMDAMSIQPVNAMSASGSGGQYSIEYKPQYNISGSMNADELQRVLDEHDAGMRDRLEEMMDDIENDRNRRRYA